MSFFKEGLKFFLIIIIIIAGLILLIKKNENKREVDIKEEVSVEASSESPSEDQSSSTLKKVSPLKQRIHLKSIRNQKIGKILSDVAEENNIEFSGLGNFNDKIFDIGLDIDGITVDEALEILLDKEEYMWYEKTSNEITIIEKK